MRQRNVVDWAVLGLSVAAIVALVGMLLVEGFGASRPADPRVLLNSAAARAGSEGWIVPADLSNDGDEPAEGVVIEASATVGGNQETSQVEVPYLPAGTTTGLAFAFSTQPDGEITVRLVSFRVP